jgi:putative oxidoreductase
MKNVFQLSFIPASLDFGLLILRVWLGISLFVRHGIEKLFGFPQMLSHFPDPIHIGVTPSLVYATLSDGICSLLVIIGLFTRLGAGIIVINLLVVFGVLHGFSFMQEHAQLVYVYLGGYLAIFIAGPGKFSIDHRLR